MPTLHNHLAALSFQEHVQKVFQKQESMQEMFHRRQASLKKLAAKQTRPVQPVAPRPEALTKSPCPSPGTASLVAPPSRPCLQVDQQSVTWAHSFMPARGCLGATAVAELGAFSQVQVAQNPRRFSGCFL